ncbi:MAG: 30S ribosome-binding factor RbfA [Pseudomonadota bacterium]
MTTFKRADRVADLIQCEISDILLKQVRDPRISALTVTGVKVTDDLRLAKIYFVELAQDTIHAETLAGLEKATGFLRRELGKRLQLRCVPDLIFRADVSFAYGNRIERLLAEIKQEGTGDDTQDH